MTLGSPPETPVAVDARYTAPRTRARAGTLAAARAARPRARPSGRHNPTRRAQQCASPSSPLFLLPLLLVFDLCSSPLMIYISNPLRILTSRAWPGGRRARNHGRVLYAPQDLGPAVQHAVDTGTCATSFAGAQERARGEFERGRGR